MEVKIREVKKDPKLEVNSVCSRKLFDFSYLRSRTLFL